MEKFEGRVKNEKDFEEVRNLKDFNPEPLHGGINPINIKEGVVGYNEQKGEIIQRLRSLEWGKRNLYSSMEFPEEILKIMKELEELEYILEELRLSLKGSKTIEERRILQKKLSDTEDKKNLCYDDLAKAIGEDVELFKKIQKYCDQKMEQEKLTHPKNPTLN